MATGKPKMSKAAALRKVEASTQDKARDKRMGYKEGSRADVKADMKQARGYMKGKK